MTIVNTSYSTLIDAWGEDFSGSYSTKKSKKKNKKDPLCGLYSQQYNDTLLPYTNRPKFINSPKYPNKYTLTQEDYDKYYGYSDIRKYSRNNAPLKNTVSQRSTIKHSVPVKTTEPIYKVNDNDDEYFYDNDDEDAHYYINNEPKKKTKKEKKKKKKIIFDDQIYQNYVDEELEEYPPSYMNEKDNEKQADNEQDDNKIIENVSIASDDSESDIVSEEDEEVREKTYVYPEQEQDMSQYNYISKDTDNSRVYLDFAIYSMSGILIIFMMEQFVQIGINIKQQTNNSMILS